MGTLNLGAHPYGRRRGSCGNGAHLAVSSWCPDDASNRQGLGKFRVGIVLVTPAMLRRLPAEGIADKELPALLRREWLVPVVHGTTYEELEQVSLLLASRVG